MTRFTSFCFLFSFVLLTGCSAMQTAIEYKELEVNATTERPLFTKYQPKTLYLVIDNPLIEFGSLKQSLETRYQSLGYTLLALEGSTPAELEASQNKALTTADLVLAIRIGDRTLEKFSARAAQGHRDVTASAGALAGAAAGFASGPGDPVSTVIGGIAGLTIGAVADVTINSWVHLGILDINADVFARERLPAELAKSARKRGEDEFREGITRVNVRARQAQIKWEEAAPAIEAALVQELGRILPPR